MTSQGVREKAISADLADLAPFFLMGMIRALVMRGLVVDEVDQSLSAETGRLLRAFLKGVAT